MDEHFLQLKNKIRISNKGNEGTRRLKYLASSVRVIFLYVDHINQGIMPILACFYNAKLPEEQAAVRFISG